MIFCDMRRCYYEVVMLAFESQLAEALTESTLVYSGLEWSRLVYNGVQWSTVFNTQILSGAPQMKL